MAKRKKSIMKKSLFLEMALNARLFTAFSVVLLIVGVLSSIGLFLYYASGLYSNPDIYFSPGDSELTSDSNGVFFFSLIIAVFIILAVSQIFMYRSLKKVHAAIGESNDSILSSLGEIKNQENDEIKELIVTRNTLLMKLMDNREKIEKAKKS